MKRFLSLAICGMMAVVFFACTKNEEPAPVPVPEQSVTAPTTDAAPVAPGTEHAAPAPAPEQQPGS